MSECGCYEGGICHPCFNEECDRVKELEKENSELREFKDSAMPILENLLFWDTVPDQWKEVISELVKGVSEDE